MAKGRKGPSGPGRGRATPKNASPTPGSVVWWGPFLNNSGYGEEARGFLRGLRRLGVDMAARSTGYESSNYVALLEGTPELAVMLEQALDHVVRTNPVTGVIHTPGYVLRRVPEADFTVGRTMFETDRLPTDWVERINLLDEVWVPSSFNVHTFGESGVTVPVRVVPSGVDASQYRPGLKPLAVPGRRGCMFLGVFEWSHRKAPDILLRAWARAFRADEDVSLVLRCYSRARFDGDSTVEINGLIDQELAAFGRRRGDVAPIIVMGRQLSAEAMPRLVASADAYVGVSRGEGWGRPLLEAMAGGLPTIGTRWGGNTDFMDDDNSLLVDVEGLVRVDEKMDVGFYRGHRWAEPSVDHLAALMVQIASDADLRRRLGKRARADVERNWQWNKVARTVTERLADLVGGTPAAPAAVAVTAGPPRVRFRSDVWADHSLATVTRELVGRLASAPDFTVEVATAETPPYPAEYAARLAGVAGAGTPRRPGPAAVEVRHSWPPDLSATSGGRLVLIQPWEYGGAPAEWVDPIRSNVDEVWVPTTWVRDCYVRSGIPAAQVAVVPNGVDTTVFAPDGPRLELANRAATRLLFVGGTIDRKGFDVLLDTYLATFGPGDDVCLVVKPFGADTVYRDSNLDARVRAAMADPRNPAIEMVDRRLSREEMAALYRACHVLVHPYRGEGFGLPVAEAMACGRPAVVTGYGACLDFCDDSTGWLVPAREVAIEFTSLKAGPAGYWWAEPDRSALAAILRQVVEGPDERRARGNAAAARIAGSWTWDHAASAAQARLAALVSGGAATRPATRPAA